MTSYSQYNDSQLLELMKSGNDAAFTEIYYRYWKLLFSITANKLQTLSDAEEVVQDVFADLWNRRAEIQITTSLKSYLAASVKYRSWTLMARRQKEQRGKDLLSDTNLEYAPSPAQLLEAKELLQLVQRRAADLPEKCQLVYRLSREEGLSNKEIATSLQVSEKAVEAHITRALRHIRSTVEIIILLFTPFN